MVHFEWKSQYDFADLVRLLAALRGEGGCPWDREQTHESIRRDFIEEVYEAVDAIDEGDDRHLCEELGDVLLQVVFHACIAEEEGAFAIADVCDGICKKLVFRHPHVFGAVEVSTADEVLVNWDELKKQERGQSTCAQALRDVPKALPALIYAEKVQKKAKKCGFDWPSCDGAVDKLGEELGELKEAMAGAGDVEDELGDLLFSAVNVARFLKIDPEEALKKASAKFVSRFSRMEEMSGSGLDGMTLEQMDKLWDRAKQQEQG